LFGAAIYLGYLKGANTANAPEVKDENRLKAIDVVGDLFNGFTRKFGNTDCHALTGCDWSKKEDIDRYYKEKVYQNTCFRQFEYVVEECMHIDT